MVSGFFMQKACLNGGQSKPERCLKFQCPTFYNSATTAHTQRQNKTDHIYNKPQVDNDDASRRGCAAKR